MSPLRLPPGGESICLFSFDYAAGDCGSVARMRDKRPPVFCRPYGAKVSGLTFFTGAYAPRLCSVALKD